MTDTSSDVAIHKESTYRIGDFVMASPPQLLVMAELQRRVRFPFTLDGAERFFAVFAKLPFQFAGMVQSVVIYEGRENLPNHSYAAGWLYEESLEQMAQMEQAPEAAGSIYFEFDGTTGAASIRVELEEREVE